MPEIKAIKEIKTVGMKYRGDNQNEEIRALWGQFGPKMTLIKNAVSPMIAYGVCDDVDEAAKTFEYVAAVGVDDSSDLPEGMVAKNIPAGVYAIFECRLPTIMETYDYIIKEWLPESDYKRRAGADFERYDETFNPEDPESTFMIYFPVEKK